MNKFSRTKNKIKLSDREKEKIFNSIIGVYSPYQKYFYFSQYAFMRVTAVVLVVFFVAGGSVSAFAENSLPGDALYVVKTEVNEKVAGAVARTPEKKIEHKTDLVVRRLEEVEKVLIKEDIAPEEKKEIVEKLAEDITEHKEDVTKDIEEVYESGDVALAVSASSELGSTLDVHADVIASVSSEDPAINEIKEVIKTHIDQEIQDVSDAKDAFIENSVSNQEEDSVKNIISDTKIVLENEKSIYAKITEDVALYDALPEQIKSEVKTLLENASSLEETAINEESSLLDDQAFVSYTQAVEIYKKINLLISTPGAVSSVPIDTTLPDEGEQVILDEESILPVIDGDVPTSVPTIEDPEIIEILQDSSTQTQVVPVAEKTTNVLKSFSF